MNINAYDIICFDVDSTLVKCEGLDWLAEQKGVGEEVKKLTEISMNGLVPMESVFSKKLDILKPSKKELESLGEYYCSQITEGTQEVIDSLRQLHLDVWLVTGSFLPAVLPLADKLGIQKDHIHANEIYTNSSDEYLGINHDCSLTKSLGKQRCAKTIGKGKKVAFVGDSITDLATKSVVTTFIGYGGVAVRQKVKDEADYFIKSQSLLPLLWLMQ